MKKMKKCAIALTVIASLLILAFVVLMLFYTPAMAEGIDRTVPAEFFSWDTLGTYAGAAALVALVTQLTKELPYVSKIPTQVWSYILAVVVLLASLLFTGKLTASSACLTLANGVLVSLASNGGYSLITRVKSASGGQ